MNNTVKVIVGFLDSNMGRIMLGDLRTYLWDGFAVHDVRNFYIHNIGDSPDVDWYIVRDSIMPVVVALRDKFGEFGTIDWEKA